ncbi:MAG TPA: polysaccharide deacetylase [Ruminiclostridium sp.]|nr:polysaccharide deacetylase [Ruminiclostridium sp.]
MKRRKNKSLLAVFVISILIIAAVVVALHRKNEKNNPVPTDSYTPIPTGTEPAQSSAAPSTAAPEEPKPTDSLEIRTDYEDFLPNEAGEIPIIMFHRFIEAYEPNTDKEYTTTFEEFRALLQTLYDQGFRLISMQDFIDCNISVPAGTMPMVFTFDDGSSGQFNLIEEDGQYKANPKSAVGVMMEFHEKHPDFGLKGIFYINMDIGDNTFKGQGALKERFEFLENLGFELGSHTWGHVDYSEIHSKDKVLESLGKNQEKAEEILPGLRFYSLALPYGSRPSDESLRPILQKGNYNGMEYYHESIMAVGAAPSAPSISMNYDSLYVRRIRAQGRVAVDADLTWWLPKMTAERMFISDGDPQTIVVPLDKAENIDEQKLNGKKFISYDNKSAKE